MCFLHFCVLRDINTHCKEPSKINTYKEEDNVTWHNPALKDNPRSPLGKRSSVYDVCAHKHTHETSHQWNLAKCDFQNLSYSSIKMHPFIGRWVSSPLNVCCFFKLFICTGAQTMNSAVTVSDAQQRGSAMHADHPSSPAPSTQASI